MAIKSIGIDIREANGKGAGKGKYAEEITKALIKNAPNTQFFLFTKIPNPNFQNTENVHQIIIPGKSIFWHFKLKKYLKHHPVDFFLAPTSFIFPAISKNQKCAIVVHDMVAFFYKKHHWLPKLVEKLTISRAIEKSDFIITISKNTWEDLKRIKPEAMHKRVVYAPPGITKEVRHTNAKQLSLPEKFILAVGTLQPRKNLTSVFRAFEKTYEKHPDLHLVIAGGKGWSTSKIYKSIPKDLKKHIHFLGYVQYPQLIELYSRAQMLVFPSLYEGFGIPPLEAMACECPVITSNSSSLPEVVGDCAIQVDPEDTEQIAAAISKMLDRRIAKEYKKCGLIRAASFSWDESAKAILKEVRS